MAIIHRIGDPENDSETKAIRELAGMLPDDYLVVHNFELTTGRGLPYEYDLCVVGEFAVYHVEVKGYTGVIRGDRHQWRFENGWVYPSPIPLANKKTKILAGMLKSHAKFLDRVFVETVVLLTDDKASVKIRDEQAGRVIQLKDALAYFTDPRKLPVKTDSILRHHNHICEVVLGTRPSKKTREIGLYDVLEQIAQHTNRVVYLAEHKFIKMRPKTVLKVYKYDAYGSKVKKDTQIRAIFHDQEALRLLSGHPNIIQTGDFFAWEGNTFVLPTEYIEEGRPLEILLDKEEDKQLSWAEKRKIVSGIARGLHHAHKGGVIHRDVRPLTAVVTPDCSAKLVNFDLAKIEGAPKDMGLIDIEERLDPRYSAPEVMEDPSTATARSDMFSLGVLFHELITGQAEPLDRELLMSELSTPGSEDFMSNPKDAVETILQMCSPDPAKRPGDMGEIIELLELIGD